MAVEKVGAGNVERNSAATTTMRILPLNYQPRKRIMMQNVVKRRPDFKRTNTVLADIIAIAKNVGRN